MGARIKTVFLWWPVRLARLTGTSMTHSSTPTIEIIGWVWLKRATISNNINHGWLAFLDATPLLPRYNKCDQLLPPNVELRGKPQLNTTNED
jgi:hypothetical protein